MKNESQRAVSASLFGSRRFQLMSIRQVKLKMNEISSNIYRVWMLFSVFGILLSVMLDQLLRQAMGLDFISQVEIYSAAWFIVLGSALIKLEAVIKKHK